VLGGGLFKLNILFAEAEPESIELWVKSFVVVVVVVDVDWSGFGFGNSGLLIVDLVARLLLESCELLIWLVFSFVPFDLNLSISVLILS
jgi:hypothetical protein